MADSSVRVAYLDGIRGWAALCVLAFHLTWETFGALHPALRHPALRLVLDGPLAVCVFFILSGDVLSLSYTAKPGGTPSAAMVVKRWFRLAGPVLCSGFLVYLLMKAGLTFHSQAAGIVHREAWLGAFLQFPPSFAAMVRFGLLQAFTDNRVATSYNPFLWPMGVELAGSLAVFVFGYTHRALRNPKLALLLMAGLLTALGSYYGLFFVGVLFGWLRAEGHFGASAASHAKWLPWAGLPLLLLLDAALENYALRNPATLSLMACALVYLCHHSPGIQRAMQFPVSRFLGRISFPLYYGQFPVLVGLVSWLIVQQQAGVAESLGIALAVAAVGAAVTVALACLLEPMERTYLRQLDEIVRTRFLA